VRCPISCITRLLRWVISPNYLKHPKTVLQKIGEYGAVCENNQLNSPSKKSTTGCQIVKISKLKCLRFGPFGTPHVWATAINPMGPSRMQRSQHQGRLHWGWRVAAYHPQCSRFLANARPSHMQRWQYLGATRTPAETGWEKCKIGPIDVQKHIVRVIQSIDFSTLESPWWEYHYPAPKK